MKSMPGTSRRHHPLLLLASLKTSALRLRPTSVWPQSSPWLTSTAYAVIAWPCAAYAARWHLPTFVDRGDTRLDFFVCGTPPLTKNSLLCWLISGIRWLASSPGSKSSSSKTGDALRHAAEGGHDAAAYLCAILLYRDNGSATADDTAKWYMRWVAGNNSTTSRWLSNEGYLPLREKTARAIHSSTWRIWGEPLLPPAQVRGDQPCTGNGGCCGVDKGWLQISLFCSEDCRLHCKMVKFERSIGIGNQ
jgi:hypothetical protein